MNEEQAESNAVNSQLKSEPNTEAENITSDAEQAATVPQSNSTENMEAHHPYHPTHKKKWNEYLLEFFMLFLAVFLGFIAENIRENIANREAEKVYLTSLVQDIKDDQATIREHKSFFANTFLGLDSLIALCDAPTIISQTGDLYYYARLATKTAFFYANTRTFEQLKSTGGFRLFKNKSIADAIIAYYAVTDQIKELQVSGDDEESNEFRRLAVQVFNADVFNAINSASLNTVSRPVGNPLLRTTDKKLLGDLAGWAHYIKNTRIGISQYENKMFAQGEKLIDQIQKEYHLDDE